MFAVIFMLITAWVVFNGVEKGIEKYSRILMPVLLLMIVAIAIFSLTPEKHRTQRRDPHRPAGTGCLPHT